MSQKGFTCYPMLIYFSVALSLKLPSLLTPQHLKEMSMSHHQVTGPDRSQIPQLGQGRNNLVTNQKVQGQSVMESYRQNIRKRPMMEIFIPHLHKNQETSRNMQTDSKDDTGQAMLRPVLLQHTQQVKQGTNQDQSLKDVYNGYPKDLMGIIDKIQKAISPTSRWDETLVYNKPQSRGATTQWRRPYGLLTNDITDDRQTPSAGFQLLMTEGDNAWPMVKRVITCQGWGASCTPTLATDGGDRARPVKDTKPHNTHSSTYNHQDGKHFQPFFPIISGGSWGPSGKKRTVTDV